MSNLFIVISPLLTMEDNKKLKKTETGGILFALFLLFLGLFAVLFEVPIFTGLYRLLSLWPLFFVGAGVWLIFKTLDKERISVVILAIILVGAMYSVFSQIEPFSETREEETVPSGVTSMDVSMDFVAGSFSIGSTPEKLFTTRGHHILEPHLHTAGSTAYLDFSLEAEAISPFKEISGEYEILLNQTLPVTISGGIGASSCTFDLSDLKIEELNLDGGLCSLEITFGETNTEVAISMGLSSVNIFVPQSVGVKIISDGLVSLSVPPGWIKTDEGYKSPNYDAAMYKIDITATVGLGSIAISYI